MNIGDERAAKRTLDAIAEINQIFIDHAIEMRRLKMVSEAINSCTVFRYETGSQMEAHLDAELKDGNAISWLLEVSWTDVEWTIRRKLVKQTNSGQDAIKELPAKTISRFEEFVDCLPTLAAELTALRTLELAQ